MGLREEEEKKDTEVPQTCLEKGTELGESLECKSDEEQLRELGELSLEKRRPRGNLLALHNS